MLKICLVMYAAYTHYAWFRNKTRDKPFFLTIKIIWPLCRPNLTFKRSLVVKDQTVSWLLTKRYGINDIPIRWWAIWNICLLCRCAWCLHFWWYCFLKWFFPFWFWRFTSLCRICQTCIFCCLSPFLKFLIIALTEIFKMIFNSNLGVLCTHVSWVVIPKMSSRLNGLENHY